MNASNVLMSEIRSLLQRVPSEDLIIELIKIIKENPNFEQFSNARQYIVDHLKQPRWRTNFEREPGLWFLCFYSGLQPPPTTWHTYIGGIEVYDTRAQTLQIFISKTDEFSTHFGRLPSNTLHFKSPILARRHNRIRRMANESTISIEDYGSTNGTHLMTLPNTQTNRIDKYVVTPELSQNALITVGGLIWIRTILTNAVTFETYSSLVQVAPTEQHKTIPDAQCDLILYWGHFHD